MAPGHDFAARRQSGPHLDPGVEPLPQDDHRSCRRVAVDHIEIVFATLADDRLLGHQHRVLAFSDHQADRHEQPVRQQGVGIGQFGPDPERTGGGIDAGIHFAHHAREGLAGKGHAGGGHRLTGSHRAEIPLGNPKLQFDGIQIVQGGQRGVGIDEVAEIDVAQPHHPAERRQDEAPLQLAARRLQPGLGDAEPGAQIVQIGRGQQALSAQGFGALPGRKGDPPPQPRARGADPHRPDGAGGADRRHRFPHRAEARGGGFDRDRRTALVGAPVATIAQIGVGEPLPAPDGQPGQQRDDAELRKEAHVGFHPW